MSWRIELYRQLLLQLTSPEFARWDVARCSRNAAGRLAAGGFFFGGLHGHGDRALGIVSFLVFSLVLVSYSTFTLARMRCAPTTGSSVLTRRLESWSSSSASAAIRPVRQERLVGICSP